MKRYILCSCCDLPVTVGPQHVGKAVVCPRTGKRLLIGSAAASSHASFALALGIVLIGFIGLTAFFPPPTRTDPVPPAAMDLQYLLENQSIPAIAPIPAVSPKIELAPGPRMPITLKTELAPPPRISPPTPRYQVHFAIPKRLDECTAEELERQLQKMNEVAIDPHSDRAVSQHLLRQAREAAGTRKNYTGPMGLGKTRPDLAGLPYCMGRDAKLSNSQAAMMDAKSLQLRGHLQQAVDSGKIDPANSRPDAPRLYGLLTEIGDSPKSDYWATPPAVPCIRQMLQSEGVEVRRLSCELLRDLATPESTEALVQWAVFDTDAGNRAAAIDALRGRDRLAVSGLLAKHLHYPWIPAVEHVCEALVALGCTEAIADVLAARELPDPDASYEVSLPQGAGGFFRRELVRINHAHNCLLCHAPTQSSNGSLVAAIPNPTQPLPPSRSQQYYSGGELIDASTTYLRQDFSVIQPVAVPGPWPKMQRYDYVVAVRRDLTDRKVTPRSESRYQRAYDFALEGLGAGVPDTTLVRRESHLAVTSKFTALQLHAEALQSLKMGKSLLTMSPKELSDLTAVSSIRHGPKAFRLALVAYLADELDNGFSFHRDRAARLLVAARATAHSENLPDKLAAAAK